MSNEHLYKRGEVWWLRATANGVEFRESLRTSDAKTARRLRDKRLAEITAAAYHGEVQHTWEEAVTEWAQHALGQLGRTTSKRYGVSLHQCAPFLKGLDISQIDGKTIQHLINQRRQVDMATPATVRRDLTAISRVLEYAEALGWREGNPTLNKRRLLKERRDPIILPDSNSMRLMVSCSSPRFAGLIQAALLTGCRQEDPLCSLMRKQFNVKTGTLEVIGKGNKRRTIQLSEAATAHLDGHSQSPRIGPDFLHAAGDEMVLASKLFREDPRSSRRCQQGLQALPIPRSSPPLGRRGFARRDGALRPVEAPRPYVGQRDGAGLSGVSHA